MTSYISSLTSSHNFIKNDPILITFSRTCHIWSIFLILVSYDRFWKVFEKFKFWWVTTGRRQGAQEKNVLVTMSRMVTIPIPMFTPPLKFKSLRSSPTFYYLLATFYYFRYSILPTIVLLATYYCLTLLTPIAFPYFLTDYRLHSTTLPTHFPYLVRHI